MRYTLHNHDSLSQEVLMQQKMTATTMRLMPHHPGEEEGEEDFKRDGLDVVKRRMKHPSQSSEVSVDSGIDEVIHNEDIHDAPIFAELIDSLPPPTEGRVLYISRHGESMYNLDNRIGGNPSLSPRGFKYAKALGSYINACSIPKLKVWTSELLRTHQTSEYVDAPKQAFAALNELDSGDLDDYTYEQFEREHPRLFKDREENKLTFRYPKGESYVDLCRRIESLMPRLNDSHNLLLICHQAVIRCVLAFLLGTAGRDVPYIKVPLHCVMKVTFGGGENHVEFHRLPVECVDTYRPRADAKADTVAEKRRDDVVEQIVRGGSEAQSETLLS